MILWIATILGVVLAALLVAALIAWVFNRVTRWTK